VERGHPEISVRRPCELLGIEAVYPKPKLSRPGEGRRIYPYLLRGTTVERVNQVWSADIAYIRMAQGFLRLVAVHQREVHRGVGGAPDRDQHGRAGTPHGQHLRRAVVARAGIAGYFQFYNHQRLRQSLDYRGDATRAPIQGPEWQGGGLS